MSALVLVDWENLTIEIRRGRYNLDKFSETGFSVAHGLARLIDWVIGEAGTIFQTFVFSPLHIIYTDWTMLHDLGFFPIVCPKIKTENCAKKDTVDPMLIENAKKWITHPEITHLCLASGDSDFLPLLREAKRRRLKIMVSAIDPELVRNPQHPPLSKDVASIADISLNTGKKMIHYFSPVS